MDQQGSMLYHTGPKTPHTQAQGLSTEELTLRTITYIFVQDNARGHKQFAKVGDVNPPSFHFGKVNARLLEKLYAVLCKHVIRQLKLPAMTGQCCFVPAARCLVLATDLCMTVTLSSPQHQQSDCSRANAVARAHVWSVCMYDSFSQISRLQCCT